MTACTFCGVADGDLDSSWEHEACEADCIGCVRHFWRRLYDLHGKHFAASVEVVRYYARLDQPATLTWRVSRPNGAAVSGAAGSVLFGVGVMTYPGMSPWRTELSLIDDWAAREAASERAALEEVA